MIKHYYLTSITQKAQRTYKRVLEGADVGVLWSYMVEGNRRTWGKPPTLDGRPLPCHMRTPGFDPGSQQWQVSALTTALSRPQVKWLSVLKILSFVFFWVAVKTGLTVYYLWWVQQRRCPLYWFPALHFCNKVGTGKTGACQALTIWTHHWSETSKQASQEDTPITWPMSWINLSSGIPTRSNINQSVQSQKMARGLKFQI